MIVWIVQHVSESGFHTVDKVFQTEKDASKYVEDNHYMGYRWRVDEWKVQPRLKKESIL